MNRTKRRGATLLELLAVVTLLGILSSVILIRYGRTIFGDFGSQADAQVIAMALRHAQRASISSGDNHFVRFDASSPTNYQLFRRSGASELLVDGPHTLTSDVTTTVSSTDMEFTFEGQALAAYSVSLAGANRSWQVNVVPVSGAIQVQETTP